MIMKKAFLLFSIITPFLLSVLTSCEKEETKPPVETPKNSTTITVISPKGGKDYNNGDSIYVSVNITSDTMLYGYRLTIRDRLYKNDIKFTTFSAAQALSYSYSSYWVNNVLTHSDLEFIATTYKGSLQDSISKIVEFHAHM